MTLMKRSVINPVLVLCGGLTVLSGFFLMFHYESHFAKVIHNVGGAILVIFGTLHTMMNWKALINSIKYRLFAWVVAFLFAISVIIMAITGERIV